MSKCNLRILGPATGPMVIDGPAVWLRRYDPEAHDGQGAVGFTEDRAEALLFDDQQHAWDVYTSVARCRPMRDIDGKANRPLTAYHAEIVDVDGEQFRAFPVT
jgi:hypothetical protein